MILLDSWKSFETRAESRELWEGIEAVGNLVAAVNSEHSVDCHVSKRKLISYKPVVSAELSLDVSHVGWNVDVFEVLLSFSWGSEHRDGLEGATLEIGGIAKELLDGEKVFGVSWHEARLSSGHFEYCHGLTPTVLAIGEEWYVRGCVTTEGKPQLRVSFIWCCTTLGWHIFKGNTTA